MERWMARGAAAVAVYGLGIAACLAGPADAASHKDDNGKSCFYARNISSWTEVNPSTVNLRVGVNDYYELKLLGDCPNLDFGDLERIGIEHQGTSWICSGLDATLIVPQPGGGIPPLRCAVRSVRKLSPEEVKALPSKDKP